MQSKRSPDDAVARAWRRVAGGRALAADAPFAPPDQFTLRLLQFLYHIEAGLGRSLPTEPFRTARTPGDFRRALAALPTPGTPDLFLLPGLGGDDPWLMRLRSVLPPSLRIATLAYPDWPERNLLAYDFSALVTSVTETIMAMAPGGTLRLAGYSLGGHLAYAAALALSAQGRTIAGVAILDSAWAPVPHAAPVWSLQPLRNFVAMALRGEALPSAAHFATKLLMKAPGLVARIAPHRTRLPLDFGFHLRRALIMELHLRKLAPWLDDALRHPVPLVAETVLFRSDAHGAEAAADLGWGRCCPNLRVIAVPGDHHDMFSPANIANFSTVFSDALGLA